MVVREEQCVMLRRRFLRGSLMLPFLPLVLPALIPSWRFFDHIGPSPRIEYAWFRFGEEQPVPWQEFRPRPSKLGWAEIARRLMWNPRWNESLFLVRCAERLVTAPTPICSREIFQRIRAEILRDAIGQNEASEMQFRLIFIRREGATLHRDIAFVSPRRSLTGTGLE